MSLGAATRRSLTATRGLGASALLARGAAQRVSAHPTVARRRPETHQAVAEASTLSDARAAVDEAPGTRAGAGAGKGDPLLGELRRGGLLPLLVLHFLSAGPSYGNQLMERISEVTGGLVAVNPNTMYPLLRSLEGRGLVAGEWEHPERRSRRFYRLTAPGEAERDRLREEIVPYLDAVARSVELIRGEVL
jgi:PadR family transcriptional regulator, regulatory protein PadR